MTSKPKTLYKYRSLAPEFSKSFVRSILRDSQIYLSSPNQFNDPFECQADILVERDDPLVAGMSKLQLLETARANLRSLLSIYSMSAVNNSVLMWSHYADNYRGICLGFDAEDQDGVFAAAEPVVYQDQLPVFDLRKDGDSIATAKIVALTKSAKWSYEQEWRIIAHAPERRINFPPKCLTEVVLGCDISKKDRLALMAQLLVRESPVRLYQARRNALRYSVETLPEGLVSIDCLRNENILDPRDIESRNTTGET
jgi:hypothetical protein